MRDDEPKADATLNVRISRELMSRLDEAAYRLSSPGNMLTRGAVVRLLLEEALAAHAKAGRRKR